MPITYRCRTTECSKICFRVKTVMYGKLRVWKLVIAMHFVELRTGQWNFLKSENFVIFFQKSLKHSNFCFQLFLLLWIFFFIIFITVFVFVVTDCCLLWLFFVVKFMFKNTLQHIDVMSRLCMFMAYIPTLRENTSIGTQSRISPTENCISHRLRYTLTHTNVCVPITLQSYLTSLLFAAFVYCLQQFDN